MTSSLMRHAMPVSVSRQPGADRRPVLEGGALRDRVLQDGVVPETRRPTVGMDALTEWCAQWLGAPPAAERSRRPAPSTRQIVRDWGVAMATATKVIAALRADGLVDPVPGRGTIVRPGTGPGMPAAAGWRGRGRRLV